MIAMQTGEQWSAGKIDRIVQQIEQGDRTATSVYQDAMSRLGRPVDRAFLGRINDNPPGDSHTQSAASPPPAVSIAEDRTATAAERSLAVTYTNQLRQDGLEDLVRYVDDWIEQGLTWPEIEARLDDLSTDEGRIIDQLYPERRLRREAGRSSMTIGQIRQYRDTTRAMFRAAGLPEGFYDSNEDFTRFIVNDVSPAELNQRIQNGYLRVANAPVEVRAELQRLYGLGDGDLAAFFLDETKALPLIQKRVASAEISGAGVRSGFGALERGESERLAELGVSADEAGRTLSTLAGARELFTPIDRGEDVITREEQLATFDNSSAARKRIEDRARRRQAAFQGGGQLATSRSGYAGLSTSSDT